MEQRPIQPLHNFHSRADSAASTPRIRLTFLNLPLDIIATARGRIALDMRLEAILRIDSRARRHLSSSGDANGASAGFEITLALQLALVLAPFGRAGGGFLPANLSDAEDGLPALEDGGVGARGRVAEAGGGEGAFGPAVVDAGEVPVDFVRGGVAVELVADVNEDLHAGDIDVVDGGEVEDHGFEGGFVGFDEGFAAAPGAGVVPRAVLGRELVG